jgi:hypothetical protein
MVFRYLLHRQNLITQKKFQSLRHRYTKLEKALTNIHR